MSKPQTPEAPSVLMAMHHRYEQTQLEYEIIDSAHQEAKENDDSEVHQLENAGQASVREADALRIAILYQVPVTTAEAAVLQYHIYTTHDLIDGCSDRREPEEEALKVAIRALFDFLCCEMTEDHEEHVGNSFKHEARRAYFERLRRTAELGE